MKWVAWSMKKMVMLMNSISSNKEKLTLFLDWISYVTRGFSQGRILAKKK